MSARKHDLEQIIQAGAKNALTFISVEDDDFEISIEYARVRAQTAAQPQNLSQKQQTATTITSKVVGYFRKSDSLEIGAGVTPETVIGVVESLGLPNEIAAGVKGTITEVLASDGEPVEYGQPLAKVGA